MEWLRGETDEYQTDITNQKELLIRNAMGSILKHLPYDLNKEETAFSRDLLLLMLPEYELLMDSFQFACKNFKDNTQYTDIAATMGFESNQEYNEIMFLRESARAVNDLNGMADIRINDIENFSCLQNSNSSSPVPSDIIFDTSLTIPKSVPHPARRTSNKTDTAAEINFRINYMFLCICS